MIYNASAPQGKKYTFYQKNFWKMKFKVHRGPLLINSKQSLSEFFVKKKIDSFHSLPYFVWVDVPYINVSIHENYVFFIAFT